MEVTKVKDLKIKNAQFGEPKVNQKWGSITVPLQYKSKKTGEAKPFLMQVPSMKAFVGVSCFNQDASRPNYTMPVSFHELETNKKHKQLLEFHKELDQFVIDTVHKNPQWLKKKKGTSRAVIEAFYTPLLRYPKDKETGEINDKYPPNLKYKLPTSLDGDFQTKVFDKDKKMLSSPLEDIPKGSVVSILAECTGLWVVNNKFGINWKARQIKVESVPTTDIYSFVEDSDDESDSDSDESSGGEE